MNFRVVLRADGPVLRVYTRPGAHRMVCRKYILTAFGRILMGGLLSVLCLTASSFFSPVTHCARHPARAFLIVKLTGDSKHCNQQSQRRFKEFKLCTIYALCTVKYQNQTNMLNKSILSFNNVNKNLRHS